MSSDFSNIEKLKSLTDELNLRDKELKEAKLILGQLPIAVICLDEDGTIVYANDLGRDMILPRKRKLKSSGIADDVKVDLLWAESVRIFEGGLANTEFYTLKGTRYEVTIAPVDYYGAPRYVVILLRETD